MNILKINQDVLAVNIYDVIFEMENNNIDPRFYSILGETGLPQDGQYVIDKAGKYTWIVYVIERGERVEEMRFAKEDEACRYFLDLILRHAEYMKKYRT